MTSSPPVQPEETPSVATSAVRTLSGPAESWIGDQISAQICRHHHRRLRRIGWEHAFDAPPGGWATGDTKPRSGNSVEILIDGAEILTAIVDELERARSHVHITGWFFTPSFALKRDGDPVVLRDLLAGLAERIDVRLLSWAGAPLPLFRPSRSDVREMRDRLVDRTRIEVALDSHERPMHCHHEKTIVIDDRVAFVGGLDLTSEAGDRFDHRHHPARAAVGWHDAATRIEGPAVTDVAEHFAMRWHEVTGERVPALPPAEPAGNVEVHVVRTIPEKIYDATPKGVFSVLESYVRALKGAKRFIYLENQFLWSPEVAAILSEKIANPPTDDFRLLLLLPAKPNSGADDTRGVLGELLETDEGNGRVYASTIYARSGARADPIYVHAKVGVVDDAWMTIGSANLNEHSLFNDTEMNIVVHDPDLARRTRLELWSEHLELPISEIDGDPVEVIDEHWKPVSQAQHELRQAGRPLTHRLVCLPHLSKRTSRLLGPISGLFVDG
jgi:phosphatidylserine/phosphatidylglycerophosphate/cardiolipin synthase-like enzyme